MASMVWKVSIVVVLVAILMGMENQIDYERLCQVSCIEAEVNKYRLDPWDVLFLSSKLCALRGKMSCMNNFTMDIDTMSVHNKPYGVVYNLCFYKKKQKSCLKIETSFACEKNMTEEREKIRWTPFFQMRYNLFVTTLVGPSTRKVERWNQKITQRPIRFDFFDFLDYGMLKQDLSLEISVYFEWMIHYHMSEKEYINLMTLLLIKLNTDCEKDPVTLHTSVFDQTELILSEGSHYKAIIAICVNFASIGISFYFIYNFILSILGPRKSFNFDPHYVPFCPQNIHRPDLMCTGSNELNIFTSYFWQGIISDHGFIHFVIFVCLVCLWIFYMLALFTRFALLGDNVSILEQFPSVKLPWYFNILDKILPYFVVFIIPIYIVFINTSIFIFFIFGFVLSLFVPENVFDMMQILPSSPGFNLYVIYIFFTILAVLFSLPFFFRNKKYLVECLNIQSLIKIFLWPTWPAQFLIFVTLKAKKRFGLSNNLLLLVWALFLALCFYVGFYGVSLYFRALDAHYYRHNTSILGFWLFVPIFILLSKLPVALIRNSRFNYYHNRISEKTWSVCFALSMTLFGVYTCNFYLFKLYSVLKEVKPGSSLLTLWIPIISHLTTYILEVWRSNYTLYETYLKSVLSYIKSGDNDGNVRNNARMENNDGDIVLVYRDRGEPNITDDKCIVKGVLIFIRDGKCYVPGDFFLEAIKLQGAPGSIKSVLIKEIWDLFLRLFPAVFIFWVRATIHLIENENYDIMLQAILNNTLLMLYKGLFLHRKAKTVDVSGNIAMQVQIDRFVKEYESWAFLSDK